MVGFNGITQIPTGLEPRLLNWASEVSFEPSYLFKARHFTLGFLSSQYLMECTSDTLLDLREELSNFAPHPFDKYTLQFWSGHNEHTMTELLVMVDVLSDGTPVANMLTLYSDLQPPDNPGTLPLYSRDDVFGHDWKNIDMPEMQLHNLNTAKAAWVFLDAFRLLLARPQHIKIAASNAPRRSLRKGKRVTYYTASEITIDIGAVKSIERTYPTGHGRAVAAYEYRAHHCHSGGQPDCIHEWIEIGGRFVNSHWTPDAENGRSNATWECYHCGRRRWHRRAGQRGDASIGFVKQRYRIKKGKDDIVPSKEG